MDSGIIEIELKGYDKYKCRKDIVSPQWFKCSNQIFEDDDLYDFSLEEMAVWLYILAQSSKQKSGLVRISVRKAATRIKPTLLHATIKKLCDLGIVTDCVRDPGMTRTDHVHVTDGICALDRSGLERNGEERSGGDCAHAPAPQESSTLGKEIGTTAGLQGNSLLDQVLHQVPQSVQRSWAETYDMAWLKECLVKSIGHHMIRQGVQNVTDVKDWPKKFVAWLGQERSPKFKPKPVVLRPKDPDTPWPAGAKERALGNVSALKAMAKVTAGGAS